MIDIKVVEQASKPASQCPCQGSVTRSDDGRWRSKKDDFPVPRRAESRRYAIRDNKTKSRELPT